MRLFAFSSLHMEIKVKLKDNKCKEIDVIIY
jgi:hypothetical protein